MRRMHIVTSWPLESPMQKCFLSASTSLDSLGQFSVEIPCAGLDDGVEFGSYSRWTWKHLTPLRLPGNESRQVYGSKSQIHLCLLKDYQHDPADARDIEQLGGMCTWIDKRYMWDQRLDSYLSHTCLILDLQTFYDNIYDIWQII